MENYLKYNVLRKPLDLHQHTSCPKRECNHLIGLHTNEGGFPPPRIEKGPMIISQLLELHQHTHKDLAYISVKMFSNGIVCIANAGINEGGFHPRE